MNQLIKTVPKNYANRRRGTSFAIAKLIYFYVIESNIENKYQFDIALKILSNPISHFHGEKKYYEWISFKNGKAVHKSVFYSFLLQEIGTIISIQKH